MTLDDAMPSSHDEESVVFYLLCSCRSLAILHDLGVSSLRSLSFIYSHEFGSRTVPFFLVFLLVVSWPAFSLFGFSVFVRLNKPRRPSPNPQSAITKTIGYDRPHQLRYLAPVKARTCLPSLSLCWRHVRWLEFNVKKLRHRDAHTHLLISSTTCHSCIRICLEVFSRQNSFTQCMSSKTNICRSC